MTAPSPPPIEPLLAALREAGLSIGVTEALRLRTLVTSAAATETIPGPPLRDLIGCVVTRSREDRATFERVFDAWGLDGGRAPEPTERARTGPALRALAEPKPKRKRLPRLRTLVAVTGGIVLASLLVFAAIRFWPEPKIVVTEVDAGAERTDAADAPTAAASTSPDPIAPTRPTQYRGRALVFSVEAPPEPSWGLALALAVAAAALLAFLLRFLSPERYFPAGQPKPTRPGPAVRPLLPSLRASAAGLLSATERSDLAFAVDRFVRDEPSPELDVPRSIDATVAEGGRPVPVFRPHTEHRTVWLWTDAAAETPLAARFSGETHAALSSAGLPCERATYHLIPDALAVEGGGSLAPHDLDEVAHGSAVLLVTDGVALARKLSQKAAFDFAAPLFRLLARWPRVALVGVTGKATEALSPLFHRFGLQVIEPDAVEGFLEGVDATPRQTRERPLMAGDVLAWGAGCALSERAVDVTTALAVRDAMKLRPATWAIDVLLGQSEGKPGALGLSQARRPAWLRWLADQTAGATAEAPVPEGSALSSALGFWRKRYEEERAQREKTDPSDPWTDTPAERRLAHEEALLDLWDKPKEAAEAFQKLHGRPETKEQRTLLSGYAVRARRGDVVSVPDGTLLLPWAVGDRQGIEAAVLGSYGLSVLGVPEGEWKGKTPGRTFVAFAMACGVLATGVVAGAAQWALRPGGAPTCSAPEDGWCEVEPSGTGDFVVRAGLGRDVKRHDVSVAAGSVVHVDLGAETWRACEENVAPNVVERRCGVNEAPWPRELRSGFSRHPPPGVAWPFQRSVGVILHTPGSPPNLADQAWSDALLDSGTADVVWIVAGDEVPMEVAAPLRSVDQVILVAGDPRSPVIDVWQSTASKAAFAAVASSNEAAREMLTGDRARAVQEAWSDAVVLRGAPWLNGVFGAAEQPDPSPAATEAPDAGDGSTTEPVGPIKNSRECPYREETVEGIELVRVCGGAFRMGDDKEGLDSEKPAHEVRISTFWIAKYEVSNKQYWERDKEHSKDQSPEWPVSGVTWDEATAFCTSRKLRLPTEAEWEYAARGPESRKYPWGVETASEKLAVMNASMPMEVTAFKSIGSPFGTANQSGNVWEWVQDCYSATTYQERAGRKVTDPLVETPRSCFRVVRGGSFWFLNPRNFRSANRFGDSPVYRIDRVGFRCVRGGSRQP